MTHVQRIIASQQRGQDAFLKRSDVLPEKKKVGAKGVKRGSSAKRRGSSVATMTHVMNLDEMLEASEAIELGMKGEKVLGVKSPKARRYADAVIKLNKKAETRVLAEEMRQNLAVRIVQTNRETTNEAESKKLYYRLMAEE